MGANPTHSSEAASAPAALHSELENTSSTEVLVMKPMTRMIPMLVTAVTTPASSIC